MFRNLFLFFCLVFFTSCNCQKTAGADENTNKKKISSEKIKGFLREKNFEIVATSNLVVVFDIEKKLIKGTTNKYSNKVVLRDTLDNEKKDRLLTLLKDDNSYDWASVSDQTNFDPTRQILVKNDSQRIFLLYDEDKNVLGFINLEGQNLIHASEKLEKMLKNISNEE